MSYIEPPFNSNPDDVVAGILDYIAARVPGWSAEEGYLEVAVAEAVGRVNAETRDLAARALTSIFRYYGQSLINLAPINAVAATALTTWTAVDNAGYTIRAGTNVGYRLSGDVTIPFQVVDDVIIPPGSTVTATGGVLIRAITPGTIANALVSADLVLIDSLAWVTPGGITATVASAGGVDAETDNQYLTRLRTYLTLLTPRPILAVDFALLARNVPDVFRAIAIDRYSPSRAFADGSLTSGSPTLTSPALAAFTRDDVGRTVAGTGVPGGTTITTYVSATAVTMSANASSTGSGRTITLGALTTLDRSVTVAAVDVDGQPVSGPTKTTIKSYLDGMREVNFNVDVTDATYTTINVAFSFTTAVGYDALTVKAAAEAAVSDFLNPGTWNGGDQDPPVWDAVETYVRRLEMASVLYSVGGLGDVTVLTLNGGTADITLAGIAPLPEAGTIVGTPV